MPVAANSRARFDSSAPCAHVQVCAHAGCPFNCITNNLYKALFAISPLFCLFALRRFTEGQGGPHPQCMTPHPAPHATRDGAPLREHLPNASDVLTSTSDVRKELLSSVHLDMLHDIPHVHVHVHMWCCSAKACMLCDQ